MSTVYSINTLSYQAARDLTDLGVKIAAAQERNMVFAVVDCAGNLLSFARMDRAQLVSIDVAIGKARTAAYFRKPTEIFADMINSGTETTFLSVPNALPLKGGLPLTHNGEVVGAIGVSGASGDIDNAIALEIAQSFNS